MRVGPRFAILGAGNMGGALIGGLLRGGMAPAEAIVATTRSPETAAQASAIHGVRVFPAAHNLEASESADVVVAAVKPYALAELLGQIRWGQREGRILVSLAAGFPIAAIEQLLGRPIAIFRAIPNLPISVGEGATAISANARATPEQYELVERMFGTLGVVRRVEERHLDVVTALAGSGPAYVCLVIEAMTAAAVQMGLPLEPARALAEQTVLGAAKLVRDSGQHPAVVRDRVTTPGGTTARGLYQLEQAGVRAAFVAAIEAATLRAQEMTEATLETIVPQGK